MTAGRKEEGSDDDISMCKSGGVQLVGQQGRVIAFHRCGNK